MSMKRTNGRLGVKAGGLGLMVAAVVSLGARQSAAQAPTVVVEDRPSGGDQAVVARLHRLNQDELAKARMGVERASRPEVRDYAAMLVREHEEADRKLIAYAELTNMDMGAVAPGGDRRPVGALTVANLSFSSDAAFDHNFATEMVASHQAAIDAAQTGQGLARAPGLPELIAQTLPTLSAHLAIAQDLVANLPDPPPPQPQPPGGIPYPSWTQTGVEERAGEVRIMAPAPSLAPGP